MRTVDIVVLVIYFLGMASLGPILARRNKNTENYFVGGRSYPGWLLGLSMFATSISSITFVAYPGDAYKTAWLRFLPCLMLPLGIWIASLIFLPFYRRARVTSAFEYLEARFGPGVRGYAAVTFILGQVTRVGMILYLVALLVHEMTGLDPYLCILVGGVVTSFYTITGGIEAVIWTDFIQSFLLWMGGFLIFYLAIRGVDGGLPAILSTAWQDGKFMLGDLNPKTGRLQPAPWGFSLAEKTVFMMLLVGLNNWLVEYSSNQNVIQKYVAAKNPKEAARAIWICCLCSVPTWAFFMLLGTSLYVFFKMHPDAAAAAMLTGEGGRKADSIIPHFVVNYMPAGISGLVIAGVLSAAMSSLSSSINAMSAVSIVDLYKRHLAPGRDDAHYMKAARWVAFGASVTMIAFAALLMWADSKTLQDTAMKLNAIFTGGLLGLYCFGFLSLRGTSRAAAVGIVLAVTFSAWLALVELKWIASPVPFDTYYGGLAGNVLMFVAGWTVATLWERRTSLNLKGLTVWTQEKEAQDAR